MDLINDKFNEDKSVNKIIITTEKDAVRLANNPYFPQALKPYIYYIPINVDFIRYLNDDFNEYLLKELKEVSLIKHNKLDFAKQ